MNTSILRHIRHLMVKTYAGHVISYDIMYQKLLQLSPKKIDIILNMNRAYKTLHSMVFVVALKLFDFLLLLLSVNFVFCFFCCRAPACSPYG